MNIIEHVDNEIEIGHHKMNCDQILCDSFAKSLQSYKHSGFCMCIMGPPGSGKTNYLCELMTKKNTNGKQKGFRNLFNNIFICCPTLASIQNSPFEDLPEEYKCEELTVDALDDFEYLCKENIEEAEKNNEEEPFHLLILDDCGTTIRSHKSIENRLKKTVANRRHGLNCSIIMILQDSGQIPPPIRSSLSHIVSFCPKSRKEKERIYDTWTGKEHKYMDQFYDFIFRNNHDTLFIDLTNNTNKCVFYRNFSLLEFQQDKKEQKKKKQIKKQ